MIQRFISNKTFCLLAILLITCVSAQAKVNGRLQILLIGDSTTIGNQPRAAKPEGPNLEQIIQGLLAAEADLPAADVFNLGLGGDDIGQLLTPSGRYDTNIAGIPDVDYIFFRYGINDWFALGGNSGATEQELQDDFEANTRALISRLRTDHPDAVIIPMTSIAFGNLARNELMNEVTRAVAADEDLAYVDIFPVYNAYEQANSPAALDTRKVAPSAIDEKYQTLIQPYISGGAVKLSDNELDPLFADTNNWVDAHPNLAGYNLIGVETVKFLAPVIRANERAAAVDTWKALHFNASELLDPLISGDYANPDKDSLINILEFALGQNPRVGADQTAILEIDGSDVGVRYTIAENRPGMTLQIYRSLNLNSWTPTAISENGLAFVSLESGYSVDDTTSPGSVLLEVSSPPEKVFFKVMLED